MLKLLWMFNRLKAMEKKEIAWRINQKNIEIFERLKYKNKQIAVYETDLKSEIKNLQFHPENMCINWNNRNFSLNNQISLFNIPYEENKKEWHAGFQTENIWPLLFSYDLDCKQRVDIGDVRTVWELNRHYQLGILAKNYYCSGKKEYLFEFIELFTSWNENNPFLHGVNWTSPMEISIRINSWIYSYCFLAKANEKFKTVIPETLFEKLRVGILNMTVYVEKHRSRFSSANNHLIIEAYSIGLVGIMFEYNHWIDIAVDIITNEIGIQNYTDGVNKEQSIHYQTFFMEAVGLLVRNMEKNNVIIPDSWIYYLDKMSQYVSDCIGIYDEVIVFGDNDEGKVLDLSGKEMNHYNYVLVLMSCILNRRYNNIDSIHENISWLYTENELLMFKEKELYENDDSICYKEGGNSILKSKDGRILIGIDHSELGFGNIAAHGHADALSFQLFLEGIAVFVDPGTYNYHYTPMERDYFRKTENHNTININNENQSEMLGPFLWGKKAETNLLDASFSEEEDILIARHEGYKPIIHERKFVFNKVDTFVIEDVINGVDKYTTVSLVYLIGPKFKVKLENKSVLLTNETQRIKMEFASKSDFDVSLREAFYSPKYNSKEPISKILIKQNVAEKCRIITSITIYK